MVDTRKKGSAERDGAAQGATPAGRPGAESAASSAQMRTSQETVSLSLEVIVTELANHVPPEKRPQVEILRRLAVEKPDQHAKIKEQMLIIAGPDALRKAVSALVNGSAGTAPSSTAANGSATASSSSSSLAAPAPAARQAPLTASVAAASNQLAGAPSAASPMNEPPMPPNLPAIFGSTASAPEELHAFKAELLHAMHCRVPSCPIAGCNQLAPKVQRLQGHVSTCNLGDCLLCSIWKYLRECQACQAAAQAAAASAAHPLPQDALGAAGARGLPASLGGLCGSCDMGSLLASGSSMMYHDELLQSTAPMPVWDREQGKLVWMSPTDALASVRKLVGGDSGAADAAASAAGAPAPADGMSADGSAKRQRTNPSGSAGDALSAMSKYPGLQQGVLQQPLWALPNSFGAELGRAGVGVGATPRVATASAPAPATQSAPRVNGGSGGAGGGAKGGSSGAGRSGGVPGRGARAGAKGREQPSMDNLDFSQLSEELAQGSKGAGAKGRGTKRGQTGTLLQQPPPPVYPMPSGGMGMGGMGGGYLPGAPFGMSASFGQPGSLSLQEMIRDTSLTDLGLNTQSMSDLSALGLSFSASRSELRLPSASELPTSLSRNPSLSFSGHGLEHLSSTLKLGPDLKLGSELKLPSELRLTNEIKKLNDSEMSISNLLNESAHEIVSGLARKPTDSFGRAVSNGQLQQDHLMDIINDFGGPGSMAAVK